MTNMRRALAYADALLISRESEKEHTSLRNMSDTEYNALELFPDFDDGVE